MDLFWNKREMRVNIAPREKSKSSNLSHITIAMVAKPNMKSRSAQGIDMIGRRAFLRIQLI